MKTAPYEYIARLVSDTNILPVTSACTNGCIFCSHKNNPEGIDVYRMEELPVDKIRSLCEFLDNSRKIVIGESASRIIEGEPFLRKDIIEILQYIRSKFPQTEIDITTSGLFLKPEVVAELKKLSPVEINISLNSSSVEGRKKLHKNRDILSGITAVNHLKKNDVPFNGSIVAMPHVVGYEDIEDTISYLCRYGAKTVRVFVPGFSKYSEYHIDFFEIRERLQQIADKLYEVYQVPILVEPPKLQNLEAEVAGIIKGSAAEASGLKKGDIILKVNDMIPLTRVDAYNMLSKGSHLAIEYLRNSRACSTRIDKKKGETAGAVFYYDMDPETIIDIERQVKRAGAKMPLVVTSKLAYPVMNMAVKKVLGCSMNIYEVENKWFGNTIMCAGLMTVSDIIETVKSKPHKGTDLVIVPSAPFDLYGRDLAGRSYYDIEEQLNIKTVVI